MFTPVLCGNWWKESGNGFNLGTLPVTLLTKTANGDATLLAAHDEVRMMLRHGFPPVGRCTVTITLLGPKIVQARTKRSVYRSVNEASKKNRVWFVPEKSLEGCDWPSRSSVTFEDAKLDALMTLRTLGWFAVYPGTAPTTLTLSPSCPSRP